MKVLFGSGYSPSHAGRAELLEHAIGLNAAGRLSGSALSARHPVEKENIIHAGLY